MKKKCMVIDYGREQTTDFITYDLWDEQNDVELKEVKISSNYKLSTGDIIYIIDFENINDIILKVEIEQNNE